MVVPAPLLPGDTVALISPSSPVNPEYAKGACSLLEAEGLQVRVMPHALGPAYGPYAASDEERLCDLADALKDPKVKAILCTRGGYGANHLIANIDPELIRKNPKWLIGFSDITALHALWQSCGVASLHAPMAKHLSTCGEGHYCTKAWFKALLNPTRSEFTFKPDPRNRPGRAQGTLAGGNIAVFTGLAQTPYDPLSIPDPVLLIEDISEQVYAVERMLVRMRLAGVFSRLKGLLVGSFTDYRPHPLYKDMEDMIAEVTSGCDFPTAFGIPCGHTDDNLPFILGSRVTLDITPGQVTLTTVG